MSQIARVARYQKTAKKKPGTGRASSVTAMAVITSCRPCRPYHPYLAWQEQVRHPSETPRS
jgi:hypothetical protein